MTECRNNATLLSERAIAEAATLAARFERLREALRSEIVCVRWVSNVSRIAVCARCQAESEPVEGTPEQPSHTPDCLLYVPPRVAQQTKEPDGDNARPDTGE
jgi:hypothetical protein